MRLFRNTSAPSTLPALQESPVAAVQYISRLLFTLGLFSYLPIFLVKMVLVSTDSSSEGSVVADIELVMQAVVAVSAILFIFASDRLARQGRISHVRVAHRPVWMFLGVLSVAGVALSFAGIPQSLGAIILAMAGLLASVAVVIRAFLLLRADLYHLRNAR